jgi:S-formylglutathione hydrolase
VAPDTSPRQTGIPDEDRDWDVGSGAGFYVDATQAPWAGHYKMQSWVTQELPAVIRAAFPIDGSREAVSGHSMGGHGALVCALRNPGRYRSVSAFAPICAPTRCPWGRKALTTYLGPDQADWSGYDASLLLGDNGGLDELLVDQGEDDEFLTGQLMPEQLEQAAAAAGCALTLRRQPGYDHSYYFIASFIAEHLRWHADRLS